ncbi:ISMca6, transposase, OrfB [Methylocaldum marinum]|uniref:ISMca6, transposase, OrfB n=1 Tax=Methylocaldum marinum TaxID=1432792 RepID=A0A250KSY3_9GAMM|nr:hypothetical protein [Methylocaldum marinum]BBA32889.1 ISMca6, transposase, OrfB [Methylocaldum marinum]
MRRDCGSGARAVQCLRIRVKGNHPKLRAAVRAVCQTQLQAEQTYTVDLGRRHRIEQRTARVWSLAVVEVRRHVEEFNPRRRCFEPRQAPIADDLVTRDASTATLAEAIRGLWGGENRLHDVLDIALGEDASRIRKNPGVFAYLRHFALNRLRLRYTVVLREDLPVDGIVSRMPENRVVEWSLGASRAVVLRQGHFDDPYKVPAHNARSLNHPLRAV